MNWKDVIHLGTAALLVIIGGVTQLGVSLPGVTVSDPKTVMLAGVGILIAGFKSGLGK